jgi:hypothetical protein
MSNKRIVGVAHVGTKPSPPTEPHTMVFNFHNFANLTKNNYTSPSILCHGYHWKLFLYPNGTGDENIGFVSLYLQCREMLEATVESLRAQFTLQASNHLASTRIFMPTFFSKDINETRFANLWSREDAISYCDANGTLPIEVSLQVYPDSQKLNSWKPVNSIATKVASLYDSKLCVDATFVVGGHRFEVHQWLLHLYSPTLVDMLGDDAAEVPINDGTSAELFETMIRFLYNSELPANFSNKDDALDLLQLADKFGCSDLKMLLEARIVETPELFCPDQAADLAILADAKNCAFLLERSLQLIVDNSSHVKQTEGWTRLQESPKLLSAAFDALVANRNTGASSLDKGVAILRKRAHDQGLDVDGSREDLMKRLKMTTTENNAESDNEA